TALSGRYWLRNRSWVWVFVTPNNAALTGLPARPKAHAHGRYLFSLLQMERGSAGIRGSWSLLGDEEAGVDHTDADRKADRESLVMADGVLDEPAAGEHDRAQRNQGIGRGPASVAVADPTLG